MNNNELLIKYFNNELNDEEKKAFDNLLDNDITFRDEFNSLKIVDSELNTFAVPLTLEDESFIVDTHKKLIKSSSHKPAHIRKNSQLSFLLLLGALVITFFALFIWFESEDNNKISHNTKQDKQITVTEINKVDNSEIPGENKVQNNIQTEGISQTITNQEKSPKESTIPLVKKRTSESENTDAEIEGKIKDINPVKNSEIIAQLQSELEQYRNSGDKLNEVWTLKRLGIFYRQLGRYSESEKYLNKALNTSEKLQDESFTAEIYGEMAYLFYVRGDNSIAEIYKTKCIEQLRRISPKRSEYWQKIFKKFQ